MNITDKRKDWLDTLWYQTVSLGAVTLAAAAALAIANAFTAPVIETVRARDIALSLSQVLPASSFDNDILTDTIQVAGPGGRPLKVHLARQQGHVAFVVFQMTGKGYAGPIDLMMGVDASGRISGVRVTRHSETPGLGDKIEAQRHPWIHAFVGKTLDDPTAERWAVRKDGGDFDQFAGATVTPRAVVAAVRQGLEIFGSFAPDIFSPPDTSKEQQP